ncbi:dynein axonemal heavy chain 9-like isoform X2 [Patagioenas fasciata]|uniref:dynein axonemal heavy chain 9-like isoform X2 n=1 Tax=Patagioenas fasciata TaxID=372321 RepID=UPI003A995F03
MRALPAARQPAPCPPPGAQRSVARSQARGAGGRGEASAGASCRSAEEPRARVIVPILMNKKNHQGWPQVVSQDIVRHVHNLKSTIFTVVGQVDGKTLLPLPAGSEGIEDIDLENEKSMERIDKSLVYAMESAIIDWSHQIQEALKKESSEPLLQGSNPNPKVELEFWKNRCDDLECIYNQLTTRKVRNMMELLERVESSYIPAFKTMLMDVEAALTEAQDVHLHLTPLKRRLEDVERVEFSEVKPFLLPLLHVVCLIWVASKHYNMPVRIVVLLQEICNLLIEQALVYLSPEDLLKGDMEESLGKVRMVLGILNMFKEAFEERREKLHMYYEPGQEVREWDFSSTMVFARLDTFLKRLEMVEDLLATSLDLMKLEKIEFSGIKGKTLGQQVLDMYEEFQEAYKVFSERTYDCLDLTNTDFEQDAFGFQQKVEDMDRRLGTIFIQAFDDASNLDHAFKLLDMFGSLLERPVVAADAAGKYSVLISMFSRALDHARLIYSRHIQAELKLGSPLCTRTCRRWLERCAGRRSCERESSCLDSAEGRRVIEKYEEMIQLLDRYQEKLYADWSQTVSEKSQYNLTQPLIRRDPETKLITVTFDPQSLCPEAMGSRSRVSTSAAGSPGEGFLERGTQKRC